MQRDPIDILVSRMTADDQIDHAELAEMRSAIERDVYAAIEWAKAEPFPSLETADAFVYYAG